jgi:tryptophan-rich sensory protein
MLAERWIAIAVAAASVTAVAVIGGLLTEIGPWYESLNFPPWRPPNWLFGPAWTLIFLLIATSGVMAWERAPDTATRGWLIGLFALNAALNVLWSGIFFKMRRPDLAFVELLALWLSIAALLAFIGAYSPTAAIVMAPYLLWVTFAGILNWRVVRLNAPFGAPDRRHRSSGGRRNE